MFIRFRAVLLAVGISVEVAAVVVVGGLGSWRHRSGMRRLLLTGGSGLGRGCGRACSRGRGRGSGRAWCCDGTLVRTFGSLVC